MTPNSLTTTPGFGSQTLAVSSSSRSFYSPRWLAPYFESNTYITNIIDSLINTPSSWLEKFNIVENGWIDQTLEEYYWEVATDQPYSVVINNRDIPVFNKQPLKDNMLEPFGVFNNGIFRVYNLDLTHQVIQITNNQLTRPVDYNTKGLLCLVDINRACFKVSPLSPTANVDNGLFSLYFSDVNKLINYTASINGKIKELILVRKEVPASKIFNLNYIKNVDRLQAQSSLQGLSFVSKSLSKISSSLYGTQLRFWNSGTVTDSLILENPAEIETISETLKYYSLDGCYYVSKKPLNGVVTANTKNGIITFNSISNKIVTADLGRIEVIYNTLDAVKTPTQIIPESNGVSKPLIVVKSTVLSAALNETTRHNYIWN